MEKDDFSQKVVRPKLHKRFKELTAEIFEDDDSENEFAAVTSEAAQLNSLSGLNLIIEYEDSRGKRSQRIISCRQYLQASGKDYLKAYCHHRSAMRSFRLDRMLDVFDPITGESLSPVEAFFAQFAADEVQKSGLTWGLSVARKADLIALLNALVFLARCDKDFHPAEREAMEQAVSSFWLRLEIAGNPDCEAILAYSDKLSPDSELFWVALHQIKTDDRLASIFRRSGQLLIEADGVVKDVEAYWAIEFSEFLND